jgi:hypothetical protein
MSVSRKVLIWGGKNRCFSIAELDCLSLGPPGKRPDSGFKCNLFLLEVFPENTGKGVGKQMAVGVASDGV